MSRNLGKISSTLALIWSKLKEHECDGWSKRHHREAKYSGKVFLAAPESCFRSRQNGRFHSSKVELSP